MTLAHILPLALLTAAWLIAAWFDLFHRRVPNWLCGLTAMAGLAMGFFDGGLPIFGSQLLHAAIVLIAGMALFQFGIFGGGDAKFYAAVATWFVLSKAIALLVSITLSGLLLFLVWFAYRRFRRLPIGKPGGNPFDGLPYGISIGAGAVFSMAADLQIGF